MGSVHAPRILSPNPYEDPSCQETDYSQERIFPFFAAFAVPAQSAPGIVS
jgi:hypothetical protein